MYFRRGPSAAFHTVTGVNDFIGLLTVPLGTFMIAVSLSYLIGASASLSSVGSRSS
jgi:hypothetical protein